MAHDQQYAMTIGYRETSTGKITRSFEGSYIESSMAWDGFATSSYDLTFKTIEYQKS